jgi:2-hydroxyacyl-CoA lyase 1
MNHQQALNTVEEVLSKQFSGDYFLVSEGARTMDVTRMLVSSHLPRRRLDAGTLGVMGIGLGYALAGQLTHPDKKVVAIMGDSAFGFSAMEIETAARCKLPLIIIIINNNGIYHGLDDIKSVPSDKLPSFTLMPETRYDLLANSVYGQGFLVKDSTQLQSALQKCFNFDGVSIVNVMIDHRPASEGLYWLTREFSPAGQSKL